MPPKAVVFDLDNCLFDGKNIIENAFKVLRYWEKKHGAGIIIITTRWIVTKSITLKRLAHYKIEPVEIFFWHQLWGTAWGWKNRVMKNKLIKRYDILMTYDDNHRVCEKYKKLDLPTTEIKSFEDWKGIYNSLIK
jgi:hypothetical protein